jgi:DNA primase
VIDVLALLEALGIRVEKRAGKRLWAICPSPDHNDHDPSWYIWNDPDGLRHGKHRCYGCGWRGGPVALVREVLGGDWDDARAWLADGSISHTPLDVQLEIRESRAIEALKPPDWVRFADSFDDWPALAVKYLTGPKRRIGIDMVRRWGLGFIAKGDRTLAGRIWLPIRDATRKLVTWQARTYIDDDLRYTTPDLVRTSVLYGTEHWPETEDRKVVVVVEGPFDALSVDRATRLPVAGIIGSNPNNLQIAAMTTFQNVVVMTDADPAGDKVWGELRGLQRWTNVVRARLADGADPGGADDATLRAALADWL